jgi:phosphoesterase RecJ-like protein
MESVKKGLEYIKKAKRIAIIGHINPDADALGSMVALKRTIINNFETNCHKITVDIFAQTNEIAEKCLPILKNETINFANFNKYDLAISVDVATRSRLGIYGKIFKKARRTLNFDHHETNEKFARNNIVATGCSSTCELLYMFFKDFAHLNLTTDILSLIYSGIITDTNNLSQNIGANTLRIVAELTNACKINSVNLETIRNHFFKSDTKEQLNLLGRALASFSFAGNGKIAMMKITKQDFADTNTSQTDTLGIVDYACKLQSVEIGILFIKQDDNTYYASLRSKGDVDVGKIAKDMGGGGSKNISAFSTKADDSLTDVKTKLIALCKAELEANKAQDGSIEKLFQFQSKEEQK